MLSSLARTASRAAVLRAPVAQAVAARYAGRFMSAQPFAVDAPNGDHDLQDVEESTSFAKRAVDIAAVSEDAAAINEVHDAVLKNKLFAVDAPDGEHDLEDVEEHSRGVKSIIDEASIFENPDEVHAQQALRKGVLKEANNTVQHDM